MRAEYLINLQPEGWGKVEIIVWGTIPGPKSLVVYERNTSNVIISIPLQDDEAKAIGKALKGEPPG